jgi:hypothetical protein
VINTHDRGRPVAWFITSDERAETIELALEHVKAKARAWKPKTFTSDCSDAEIKAISLSRHQGTSLYLARQASVVEELVRPRIGRRQGSS